MGAGGKVRGATVPHEWKVYLARVSWARGAPADPRHDIIWGYLTWEFRSAFGPQALAGVLATAEMHLRCFLWLHMKAAVKLMRRRRDRAQARQTEAN